MSIDEDTTPHTPGAPPSTRGNQKWVGIGRGSTPVGQAITSAQGANQSTNDDPEDLTGSFIGGRYKLLRLLDRGGMGYVYYAKHTAIDKRLAIKILSLKCARSEQHRTRLLREARACSQIAHENVVDILDFGQAPNGSVFIAMELLRGETLAAIVDREGAMPWRRAKPIILQIARALHAAHTKGILHRDLKPDNIWRTKRGANKDFIKVYDFGLAKLLQDDSFAGSKPITSAGTIFGTPEYMSPEQARGEPTDARSDLYSTAIILYELLTGTVPFLAENFLDVLAMQATEAPRSPRTLAPPGAISPKLERVILKALEKDPRDRYQTMQEFATALARVPSNETPHPHPRKGGTLIPPTRTPTPRNGLEFGAGVLSGQTLAATDVRPAAGGVDVPIVAPMGAREKIYLTIIAAQTLALIALALAT
ncbi:MAG: serine/threonine protein kinase [Myxococcales bacterium]|nr:serine/threonine protein kinase [Myxococcales bacterium]